MRSRSRLLTVIEQVYAGTASGGPSGHAIDKERRVQGERLVAVLASTSGVPTLDSDSRSTEPRVTHPWQPRRHLCGAPSRQPCPIRPGRGDKRACAGGVAYVRSRDWGRRSPFSRRSDRGLLSAPRRPQAELVDGGSGRSVPRVSLACTHAVTAPVITAKRRPRSNSRFSKKSSSRCSNEVPAPAVTRIEFRYSTCPEAIGVPSSRTTGTTARVSCHVPSRLGMTAQLHWINPDVNSPCVSSLRGVI